MPGRRIQVSGGGVGTGGARGQPDQQFVMLRTGIREKILRYIRRKQSSAEWQRRMPELAKRLEEILYRKYPNKYDYYNMTVAPVEPELQFAIRTLIAQNEQNRRNRQLERQTPPSSSSNPDMNHDVPSEQFASPQADMQNNNADEHNRTVVTGLAPTAGHSRIEEAQQRRETALALEARLRPVRHRTASYDEAGARRAGARRQIGGGDGHAAEATSAGRAREEGPDHAGP